MKDDRPGAQPAGRRRRDGTRHAPRAAHPASSDDAAGDLERFLREHAEQRPYAAVAAAAGVGYVLGGGVPTRLLGVLLGLGSRYAVEMFLRELVGAPKGGGARAPQRSTP